MDLSEDEIKDPDKDRLKERPCGDTVKRQPSASPREATEETKSADTLI